MKSYQILALRQGSQVIDKEYSSRVALMIKTTAKLMTVLTDCHLQ